MEGSSSEKLVIGVQNWSEIDKNDGLTELDDRILSFHNLRALSRLHIACCQKLSSISLEGFRQLISLKTMDISYCFNLFSSGVPPPPEHTHEDMTDINFNALPSLKHLRIQFCGITGMWLSVMLRHAPALEELYLLHCHQISRLLIEVGDSSSSNHTSAPRAPSAGNPDDALTSSTPDGLLHIPSNSVSSLKKMSILWCRELTFQGNKEGFSGFTSLEELTIRGCPKLSSISLEGFRQLISLKTMDISFCFNPFSSGVPPPPEHTHEDMTDINFNALPSLKHLRIQFCGITGMWLSVMLRHAPALEELRLYHCDQISGLLIEVGDSSSSNHTSAPRAPSAGNPDDALTSSTPDGLLRIPSNLIPSLKSMTILSCRELTFQGNKDGISVLTSLEELTIRECSKLIPSLVQTYENNDQRNGRWLLPYSLGKLDIEESPETLQPCFLEDHNCLKKLEINNSPSLKLLQLHSCTALEELTVHHCASLAALEGNFTCLKELELVNNSVLELPLSTCTALERLRADGYSFLTTSFWKCLTSLRRLELRHPMGKVTGLTEEQERALPHLTSLQELRFEDCPYLAGLPVGLHSLSSLKRLEITDCPFLSRLPEKGLPPSLEEIEISSGCSKELTDECRMLATKTRKPKVKIDGKYVK